MKGQVEVDQENLPGSGKNWKNKLTIPKSPNTLRLSEKKYKEIADN